MSIAWCDGLTLTAEAALSAATGTYTAWGGGTWGAATWGPDVTYIDISSYLRDLRTDRAFSREVNAWDPGTATMVLSNRDARFSPDNLSGPYVSAGVTQVRPWRPVRLTATYAGVTYPLYAGYALDWVDRWADGHADATVTVPCVDELATLADVDGLEQLPVGAGETSGARVHRILDNAGYTGPRAVDPGLVTMQATTLAANAVSELKLTADSEGGALFVDADGTVVFEDQYALMESTRSNTIQATLGDGSGSELPCRDVTPVYAGDQIRNIIAYARVGGTAQVASDPASRALYRDKQYARSDLICETDAQALALANFALVQHKDPARHISAVEITPRRDPVRLFPKVLGLRVRDLVRVVARPIGGVTVTRDCHIAGIHHEITGDQWITRLDLWDATIYQLYADARWDVGTWDGARTSWFF